MAKQIKIDTNYVKTYATIANLEKAVDKFDARYLVCLTEEGRYYATFVSNGNDPMPMVWAGHAAV